MISDARGSGGDPVDPRSDQLSEWRRAPCSVDKVEKGGAHEELADAELVHEQRACCEIPEVPLHTH
jgi:hypothetical protein